MLLSSAPVPPARTSALAGSRAYLSPGDLIGDTPLLWVGQPFTGIPAGFWAKLEGHNPGGIKDRAAVHMVAAARARGTLTAGARIVESTSGTFGLGLALAGSLFGHPVTLVTDPGLEPMMAATLSAAGATIVYAREPHPQGGWQQARRDVVASIVDSTPGAWCPDQYHNPDAAAGYAGLGRELVTQLGEVDVLVCAVGTGGHSAGVHAALAKACPQVRLIGVDTTGSTIFGQPARSRLMRGLGSSILPGNVAYHRFSEVHWVAAAEAVWAARRLAAAGFPTGGWSVGAVSLVAGWVARTSPASTVIAAVFPDGPARYATTVFDDTWCTERHLLGHTPADGPEVIGHPGEREVTRWTRCATITAPAARTQVLA